MNQCLVCSKETRYTYCSLSCSNTSRTTKNEAKYHLLNPKLCKQCQLAIPYVKRFTNDFCSHSCSATYSNTRRKCKGKTKPLKENHSLHAQRFTRFELGLIKERPTLRNLLIETRGNTCSKCNLLALWHGEPLTLIVDHKDGNAGNNLPDNLQLLCPNCNSQTPTFSGRNRGSGRKARGLPR